ncbi:MAG: hypothetical protein K2J08_08200 [Ruminococcus sp.]|nr:hypothetical protein [Ruminococcus sp.]
MEKILLNSQHYKVFETPDKNTADAVRLRKEIHSVLVELNEELENNDFLNASGLHFNENKRHMTSEYVFTRYRKNIYFISLRYWNKTLVEKLSESQRRNMPYYPHIEIKAIENGLFVGVYITDYSKTSGVISQNRIKTGNILRELKEHGYFWEWDGKDSHDFKWIEDTEHESAILKNIASPDGEYASVNTVKCEIKRLLELLKLISV